MATITAVRYHQPVTERKALDARRRRRLAALSRAQRADLAKRLGARQLNLDGDGPSFADLVVSSCCDTTEHTSFLDSQLGALENTPRLERMQRLGADVLGSLVVELGIADHFLLKRGSVSEYARSILSVCRSYEFEWSDALISTIDTFLDRHIPTPRSGTAHRGHESVLRDALREALASCNSLQLRAVLSHAKLDSEPRLLAKSNNGSARAEMAIELIEQRPNGLDALRHAIVAAAPEVLASAEGIYPRPVGSILQPRFDDSATRLSRKQLENAYERRRALSQEGIDTTGIDGEITALKRALRDDGRIKAGYRLGDGRYRLLELIGEGGFASVWKARDNTWKRIVAIKILQIRHMHDESRRLRFARGAKVMARLEHPHIVKVCGGLAVENGIHYFVLEYLEGGSLAKAVVNEAIDPRKGLEIILRIGEALAYAHNEKIIHRDVKPSNILRDRVGAPYLSDFDLVHAADTTGGTRTGALVGTFLYTAPEIMENAAEVSPACDVYSLGITTIFVLFGGPPFKLMRNVDEVIDTLTCDLSIKQVLRKAIAWEPSNRYVSMKDFCDALADAVERENVPSLPRRRSLGESSTKNPPILDEPEGSRPKPDTNRWVRVGVVVLSVALLVLLLAKLLGGQPSVKTDTENSTPQPRVGATTTSPTELGEPAPSKTGAWSLDTPAEAYTKTPMMVEPTGAINRGEADKTDSTKIKENGTTTEASDSSQTPGNLDKDPEALPPKKRSNSAIHKVLSGRPRLNSCKGGIPDSKYRIRFAIAESGYAKSVKLYWLDEGEALKESTKAGFGRCVVRLLSSRNFGKAGELQPFSYTFEY